MVTSCSTCTPTIQVRWLLYSAPRLLQLLVQISPIPKLFFAMLALQGRPWREAQTGSERHSRHPAQTVKRPVTRATRAGGSVHLMFPQPHCSVNTSPVSVLFVGLNIVHEAFYWCEVC
jgi:hypothetical protein